MGEERRTEPRVSLRRLCQVQVGSARPEHTYTINLSLGGMSFEAVERPASGAPVAIRLELSDGDPLELAARVRYSTAVAMQGPGESSSQYWVGVQFEPLGSEARQRIEAALRTEEDDG